MQTNAFVLALAAGVISAIVFASATTGIAPLRFLLYVLTPLSLYLTGLALGPIAGAIAAIAGTAVIVILGSPPVAFAYGLSTALPAYVMSQRAVLSHGDDSTDAISWYPVGRLVVLAALFGGAFAGLILIIMGGDADSLTKTVRPLIENFVKSDLPNLPGRAAVDDQQINDMTASAVMVLPLALGIVSMGTILFNLWLAGRITLAAGHLSRPWPALRAVELPPTATFALLASMVASFASGAIGPIASGFAGALIMAFALVGLAVLHTVLATSPWRSFALWAIYVSLALIAQYLIIPLAIGGLAETIFRYRRRLADTPPSPD